MLWQMKTLIYGFIGMIVFGVLIIIGFVPIFGIFNIGPASIGNAISMYTSFIVLALTTLWFLYRVIKGMMYLNRQLPMPKSLL